MNNLKMSECVEYLTSNEELNYVLIQKIEIEGVNCGKNEK